MTTEVTTIEYAARSTLRKPIARDVLLLRLCLVALWVFLIAGLVLPISALLLKSVEGANGEFVGLRNFTAYFQQPGLSVVFWNSLRVSFASTVITLVLASFFAFALTHSRMPGKGVFRAIALAPLLTPSLLPGVALIYLFGNQGIFRDALLGYSLYGPIGIVLGEVFFSFPIAVLVISTSMQTIDQRLYEAAESLRAGRLRIFLTVTMPAMRYGLGAAFFATFIKAFTDFGVPAVVGGSFTVLATDLYQKIIGGFDFRMGSVVGILLLVPAVIAFVADRLLQRGRSDSLSGRSVVYSPKPRKQRDLSCFIVCTLVGAPIIVILVMAVLGSLFRLWPYDLALSLASYRFGEYEPSGWSAYWNSLKLATATAAIGTALIFFGAYLVERTPGVRWLRSMIGFICMMPVATPGMVLGLSYIFFFNNPGNPLHLIYGTLSILVLSTIVHLYTVPHLTSLTALKQLDPELESIGDSLKASRFATFWRVTVPVCLPTVLRIAAYLFMNAMTTISAVVFLYSADTKVSTISIVLLNDNGMLGPAAAMSVLILATSAGVVALQTLLLQGLLRRTQAWRPQAA